MGTVIQFKRKSPEKKYWSPLHPAEYLYQDAEGRMVGTAFVHQYLEDIGGWNVNYLFKSGLGQAPETDVYKGNYTHPEVFMMSAIREMHINGQAITDLAETMPCSQFVAMCLHNAHLFEALRDHNGKKVWHKETPSLQALFDRMLSRAEASTST